MLVFAAEQLYGSGKGATKLDYVVDELEARGITVDLSAIEAAVREMNLEQSWLKAEQTFEPENETENK